jgi:type IV pilus assembly protein PilB
MPFVPPGQRGPSSSGSSRANGPGEITELPADALIELDPDALSPLDEPHPAVGQSEETTQKIAPVPPKPPRRRLGEILVAEALIDEDQLQQALSHQVAHGGRLGSVLVALGMLSDDQLASNLSRQLGVMVHEVDTIAPTPRVLAMVPEAMIRKHESIPLRLSGEVLVVGMVDPTDELAVDELIFVSGGREVQVEMITEATLRRFIKARFADETFQDQGLLDDFEIVIGDDIEGAAGQADSADGGSWEAVHLTDFILDNALKRRATDIHIEPYETFFRVRLRVDGTLYNLLTPPPAVQAALVSRLKALAGLDNHEPPRPQEGKFRTEIGGETVDLRLSCVPTTYGEKCVVHLITKEAQLTDLATLGFRADQLAQVRQATSRPKGLVLVSGPVGAGTTTTIHAVLNTINEPDINIVTLGENVETAIPGVNHVPIAQGSGVALSAALRSILRQDPDVVFVDTMRDRDLADEAIKAALDGKLVLATLRADGVLDTFQRLLDSGVDPYLLASATDLVLSQRLLRRVCPRCSQKAPITAELAEEFSLTSAQIETAARREPRGCPACLKTGYKGRVAVYESMSPTHAIRRVLREGADSAKLASVSRDMGMVPMWDAGVARALAGETTFAEVRRRLARPR